MAEEEEEKHHIEAWAHHIVVAEAAYSVLTVSDCSGDHSQIEVESQEP